jgi:hydroxymethylglutaryl-CoA lyase
LGGYNSQFAMANPVKIIECPRDAWQGLETQIPTEAKAGYLRALINAGFKHIDAASFVSTKAVPQMADSEKVLTELDPPDDVEIIGIVVNEKGVDRAIATEAVRTVGFPYSISETFLRRNQNQTPQENYEAMEQIYKKADEAGLDMVVYISMAFGNPYGDLWNLDEVMAGMENITDLGVRSISLADTVGVATPEQVATLAREACERFEDYDIGVHLHSRRDRAAAKILAAYDAGVRRFDSAIGGLGGCPFASDGLVGNIPTEILLKTLEDRGIGTPIRKSLDGIIAKNAEIALGHF